jgi:hypothetical protein
VLILAALLDVPRQAPTRGHVIIHQARASDSYFYS